MPDKPFKKPAVLKNVKRKTGAKAQAKQISALTSQVVKINKEQTENVRTSWYRQNLPIGNVILADPYICPLPYVMCDPLGTSPVVGSQNWTDNVTSASQPVFEKRMIFGYSDAAANSNKVYHTGGRLRYQIWTSEPSFTKLGLYLIRPKKKMADQLVLDRKFKAGPGPAGEISTLSEDVDYVVHKSAPGLVDTFYGSEINRKYWDVLYHREITLSHPEASGFSQNANANNASPANNALTASGTIKIPAGGLIRNVSTLTQTSGDKTAGAFECQYQDQHNETGCFLVGIHNDLTLDAQTLDLGFIVTDYYKVVV